MKEKCEGCKRAKGAKGDYIYTCNCNVDNKTVSFTPNKIEAKELYKKTMKGKKDRIEERVNKKLLDRGFRNEYLINNRGLIGAVMEEYATQQAEQSKPLKMCTGCGTFSDIVIDKKYLSCCPDSTYKIVTSEIIKSHYKSKYAEQSKEKLPIKDNIIISYEKVLDLLNWVKSDISREENPKLGKTSTPYRREKLKFLYKIEKLLKLTQQAEQSKVSDEDIEQYADETTNSMMIRAGIIKGAKWMHNKLTLTPAKEDGKYGNCKLCNSGIDKGTDNIYYCVNPKCDNYTQDLTPPNRK